MSQTIILRGPSQRALAKQVIDRAPQDAVVRISEPTRNGIAHVQRRGPLFHDTEQA